MRNLFKIFKKGTSAYFHEDLYCQVELLPYENLGFLKKENASINNFAQENSDGVGFTDIYERDNSKFETASKSINVNEFTFLMDKTSFNKVDKVYTGYSNYREICKNILCYKLDRSVVFCEFQDEKIKNLFIQGFRFNNESPNKKDLIQTLNQLGTKWNMLLNDWDLCEVINLKDTKEIEEYVSKNLP